jgi:oxygen-dependent protoporphyrinogen oxidase
MVGGARASALARESDPKLIASVRSEVGDIMGIKADPDFVRIYRHEMAIPQYTVGHFDRMAEIDALLAKYRNLHVSGNAYRGIGVNDCIENSWKLAEKIAEGTA